MKIITIRSFLFQFILTILIMGSFEMIVYLDPFAILHGGISNSIIDDESDSAIARPTTQASGRRLSWSNSQSKQQNGEYSLTYIPVKQSGAHLE